MLRLDRKKLVSVKRSDKINEYYRMFLEVSSISHSEEPNQHAFTSV